MKNYGAGSVASGTGVERLGIGTSPGPVRVGWATRQIPAAGGWRQVADKPRQASPRSAGDISCQRSAFTGPAPRLPRSSRRTGGKRPGISPAVLPGGARRSSRPVPFAGVPPPTGHAAFFPFCIGELEELVKPIIHLLPLFAGQAVPITDFIDQGRALLVRGIGNAAPGPTALVCVMPAWWSRNR